MGSKSISTEYYCNYTDVCNEQWSHIWYLTQSKLKQKQKQKRNEIRAVE